MKKTIMLIAAIITMAISSAAFASEDITVLYNGLPMNFSDVVPVIIEGRVMLPFRAVFEQLNAEVGYDDESRTVSAYIGGRSIYFSLSGSEIFAVGQEEPIYVMDVLPVIEEGRTLVPVRAIAEAGGLTVGWDGDNGTVVIIDEEEIAENINNACPSLKALREILENPLKIYAQNETTKIMSSEFTLTAKTQTTSDGEAQSSQGNVELTVGESSVSGNIELILTKERLLFKTDIIEKLGDALPSGWAVNIPADKWMSAEWGELEEYISGADRGELKSIAETLLNGTSEIDLIDELIGSVTADLDPDSAASARQIPANLAAISEIFGADSLRVTPNADGTAEMRLTISRDASASLIGGGGAYLSYSATYSGGVDIASETVIEYGEGSGEIRIESSVRGEIGTLVEKILIPDTTVNFVDVLYTLQNFT